MPDAQQIESVAPTSARGLWALMQRVEAGRYRAELLDLKAKRDAPTFAWLWEDLAEQQRQIAEQRCALALKTTLKPIRPLREWRFGS